MAYLFSFALSMALIVFQSTVLAQAGLVGDVFDLLLPVIAYFALFQPRLKGLIVVLGLGYIKDALCGGPFGLHMAVYVWIYLGIRGSTAYLRAESPTLQPLLLGGAAIIENLLFIGFIALSGEGDHGGGLHARRMFTQTISASLLGPLILQAIRLFDDKTRLLGSVSRGVAKNNGETPP